MVCGVHLHMQPVSPHVDLSPGKFTAMQLKKKNPPAFLHLAAIGNETLMLPLVMFSFFLIASQLSKILGFQWIELLRRILA